MTVLRNLLRKRRHPTTPSLNSSEAEFPCLSSGFCFVLIVLPMSTCLFASEAVLGSRTLAQ
eukprot:m.520659 g.520659  ORF g.520659 m.520659 type:complete len:61 (+) comp57497_c0_seq19:1275-1457(+)